MKVSTRFLLTIIIFTASVVSVTAQPQSAEQTTESSNTIEEQAQLLLDQVIAGIGTLKLPENRCRLQIAAAELLWKRDQAGARSLFSDAAANVVELRKQTSSGADQIFSRHESAAQLRQELILTAAKHDPALADQLLEKTRPPKSERSGPEDETYLEQLLLNQTIATDPDIALRKAEAMLDRGNYSVAILSVLEKLQEKNKPGAARLTEKIISQLQPETLLSNYGATSVALGILRSEPRSPEPAYRQLLENVIVAALKATPNQQDNSRDLLLNLRPLLPQIEQYLPARAQAVRQKISVVNDTSKIRSGMDQLTYLTPQSASNNLLPAAASAPSEMQLRKATSKLDALSQKLEASSEQDRVSVLLQLSEATKTDNPKHSRQLLDEALGLVTRPATSYKQFEDQLQVAHVLGADEPQRSLDLLESGITKLNELLSAAASLSGFEVQIFKPAEMSLPGHSKLGAVVIRYGQELAILAKSDFGRASAAAEQFQYPESRLFARLSIVQSVLKKE